MKQGRNLAGYALVAALVLLVGLIITTVARDMTATDETAAVPAPRQEETAVTTEAAPEAPQAQPQQSRVWEGTM